LVAAVALPVNLAFFKSATRPLNLFAGILGQKFSEFFPNSLDVFRDPR
jgi:hypothetical protein